VTGCSYYSTILVVVH